MPLTHLPELDRQHETHDGIAYVRCYACPPGEYGDVKPAEGSLMPGASGLLGARVTEVIRRAEAKTALDRVEVRYLELKAAAGGAAGEDYAEIRPRRRKKTAEALYVTTTAVATDATHAPDEGDALAGEADYRCAAVEITQQWKPGRTLVVATYAKPVLDRTADVRRVGELRKVRRVAVAAGAGSIAVGDAHPSDAAFECVDVRIDAGHWAGYDLVTATYARPRLYAE